MGLPSAGSACKVAKMFIAKLLCIVFAAEISATSPLHSLEFPRKLIPTLGLAVCFSKRLNFGAGGIFFLLKIHYSVSLTYSVPTTHQKTNNSNQKIARA